MTREKDFGDYLVDIVMFPFEMAFQMVKSAVLYEYKKAKVQYR